MLRESHCFVVIEGSDEQSALVLVQSVGPAGPRGSLVLIDRVTGKVVWRHDQATTEWSNCELRRTTIGCVQSSDDGVTSVLVVSNRTNAQELGRVDLGGPGEILASDDDSFWSMTGLNAGYTSDPTAAPTPVPVTVMRISGAGRPMWKTVISDVTDLTSPLVQMSAAGHRLSSDGDRVRIRGLVDGHNRQVTLTPHGKVVSGEPGAEAAVIGHTRVVITSQNRIRIGKHQFTGGLALPLSVDDRSVGTVAFVADGANLTDSFTMSAVDVSSGARLWGGHNLLVSGICSGVVQVFTQSTQDDTNDASTQISYRDARSGKVLYTRESNASGVTWCDGSHFVAAFRTAVVGWDARTGKQTWTLPATQLYPMSGGEHPLLTGLDASSATTVGVVGLSWKP